MSVRYCLNVHDEMLCDGPQDHDGGCTFTAAWQLVRRIEDDFLSLVAYSGDTTNELRAIRESVFAAAQQVRREGYTALAERLEQTIEDAEARRKRDEQENAAWWISHDGKRRLRAVQPHQGDYEPPEVDYWRPGDHRPERESS